MPKIDLSTAPRRSGTGYPPPYDTPCRGRSFVQLAAAAVLWIGFKVFRKTPAGARLLDTLVVKLPMFGELFLKAIIARFGRFPHRNPCLGRENTVEEIIFLNSGGFAG